MTDKEKEKVQCRIIRGEIAETADGMRRKKIAGDNIILSRRYAEKLQREGKLRILATESREEKVTAEEQLAIDVLSRSVADLREQLPAIDSIEMLTLMREIEQSKGQNRVTAVALIDARIGELKAGA